VVVSPDAASFINDVLIRRKIPIPARNTKTYIHATQAGPIPGSKSDPKSL
jgi:molecular chaperone DnaK